MKESLALLALVSAGCLSSNINGATNGSPRGSSVGGSSAGASSAGASTAGTTAGPGTTGGSTTGTAGASSTGTGTGGTSGGSTTSGTTTGPCIAFEDSCDSNAGCCSGACLGVCRQPAGQPCLTDTDCSSDNCANDVCACSTPADRQTAVCASDADCCNGIPCHVTPASGQFGQYGVCCNPNGGSCQGNYDCCDSNCVNGTCSCLAVDSEGCQSGQCCLGACVDHANGGGVSACLNGAGDPCAGPWQCINSHCTDGACGTCSAATGGFCATTADCCAGGVCAENLFQLGQYGGGPAFDAGLACCADTGSSCDGGENRRVCCSGQCSDGLCTCAHVGDQCFNSASCCAGEACLGGAGQLACCQMDSQFCLSDFECCSGNCQNQACACVADGGSCGAVGTFAAEGPAACCSGVCGDAGVCN